MDSYQSLFLILGIAMCALVFVQLGLWAAQSLTLMGHSRRQFELSRALLNQQVESVMDRRVADVDATPADSWTGFRTFIVNAVVRETQDIVSVYLKPEDGKSIPSFLPGQHLTIKMPVPGQAKPVVRCYSLSCAPQSDHYRISVKAITTPLPSTGDAEVQQVHRGVASHFINTALCAGDRIEVKAPSGNFVLDHSSELPVILLAGGIGVTPMVSILQHLASIPSSRLTLLLYGVRNSAQQAFADAIKQITDTRENFHAIHCFSRPLPTDVPNQDFQVEGFVSVDLLKQMLPNNHCQFYLCGPPAFMETIYDGLIDWQVPQSRIFYEAFGPASIGKKNQADVLTSDGIAAKYDQLDPVTFAKSDRTVLWSENHDSLLELAESHEIFPESGCRAGSCGSCETAIVQGKVRYPDGQSVDCAPRSCLLCLAKPDGPVELDL
jgi:ferredoxin-NADP reductase